MADGFTESIEAVTQFLRDLKQILHREDFNIETDFYILQGDNPGSTGYKNKMTIVELGYDSKDVCDILAALAKSDYCETVPDKQYSDGAPLRVFGKTIGSRDVYIKISILTYGARRVFTLSFHFAEYPLRKPYSY
jgi:hypothetical protein